MPEITLDLTLFATAFVTVLVIMDPVGNIPIFLALTKGQDVPQRRRAAALLASTVAGAVILAFALCGQQVLELLGISLESLQVAGGLLLLVIALELLHPSGGGSSPWPPGTPTSRSCRSAPRCWPGRGPSQPPCSTAARPTTWAARSPWCSPSPPSSP